MLSDIALSGFPRDLSIIRAELLGWHRVRKRQFLLDFIPSNSIGAELGAQRGRGNVPRGRRQVKGRSGHERARSLCSMQAVVAADGVCIHRGARQ